MLSLLSALFSGLWQALLSKFGLSADQKLGRLEVESKDQSNLLKEAQDAHDIAIATSAIDDSDKFLHTHHNHD